MSVLPGKLSELILVALADLRKAEAQSKIYKVEMLTWHESYEGLCNVCLAGSVIAKSLGGLPHQNLFYDSFPKEKPKLLALNNLCSGFVQDAYADIHQSPWNVETLDTLRSLNREITDYADDPEAFHAEMLQLANDLAAKGF